MLEEKEFRKRFQIVKKCVIETGTFPKGKVNEWGRKRRQ